MLLATVSSFLQQHDHFSKMLQMDYRYAWRDHRKYRKERTELKQYHPLLQPLLRDRFTDHSKASIKMREKLLFSFFRLWSAQTEGWASWFSTLPFFFTSLFPALNFQGYVWHGTLVTVIKTRTDGVNKQTGSENNLKLAQKAISVYLVKSWITWPRFVLQRHM